MEAVKLTVLVAGGIELAASSISLIVDDISCRRKKRQKDIATPYLKRHGSIGGDIGVACLREKIIQRWHRLNFTCMKGLIAPKADRPRGQGT